MHSITRLLLITLLFSSQLSFSQTTLGVKGGGQIADIVLNDAAEALFSQNNYDFKPSFHVGAFLNLDFRQRSSLNVELLYADKGCKGGPNLHIVYLSWPILYRYNISEKFGVQAGVELGYLLSSYYNGFDGKRSTVKEQFGNPFDFGLSAGLVFQMSRSVHISVRYTHGLSNVLAKNASISYTNGVTTSQFKYRDEGVELNNRVLQISVGYAFTRSD